MPVSFVVGTLFVLHTFNITYDYNTLFFLVLIALALHCLFAPRSSLSGAASVIMYSLSQEPTLNDSTTEERPPCCTLCRTEVNPCSSSPPSFLGIQDATGCDMDVRASFAPTSLAAWTWKIFATTWAVFTLVFSITKFGTLSFYLAELTHWSLVAAVLYMLSSLWQTMTANRISQPEALGKTGAGVSTTWILFAIAAHAELMIAILFWLLVYDYDSDESVTYLNIMEHGGMVVLVWIDGLVVNRIPVKWKHWWGAALPFELCWAVWSICQSVVFEIGNPNENEGDDNDDAIYEALDWKNDSAYAFVLTAVALLVLGPIVHIIIWLCSWYTWPCCCRGNPRRYLDDASASPELDDNRSTSDPEEGIVLAKIM
jgi:hypothetical protein